MRNGNMFSRRLLPCLFLAFGVLLIVISVRNLNARKSCVPGKGVISEIDAEESVDPEDGDSYTVYVDYSADGKLYEHVYLNQYRSSFYVGKEIDILYDPADPSTIFVRSPVGEMICLVIGGLMLLADAAYVLRRFRK